LHQSFCSKTTPIAKGSMMPDILKIAGACSYYWGANVENFLKHHLWELTKSLFITEDA
jgi:hypothetical protein